MGILSVVDCIAREFVRPDRYEGFVNSFCDDEHVEMDCPWGHILEKMQRKIPSFKSLKMSILCNEIVTQLSMMESLDCD
jgi:hypothetical protein